MHRTSLLALSALLLLPAAGGAQAPAAPADEVLAVRYAFVVGGRDGAAAPPAAGVLSQPELTDFLSGWNPDRDYEEVREVFALNDLGEVARQAVLLPAEGGELTGRFSYRGAALELRLRVEPGPSGVDVRARVERESELLLAATAQLRLGERAILSGSTKRAEMPFAFLVVEIEASERERIVERGLPTAWKGRALRVDGVDVLPPKLLESTQPVYPEAARKERVEGTVVVDALIDEAGAVRDVRVVRGQSHGLSEAAVEAVRQWRFAPATAAGEPVAVEYTLTIRFRLQKEPLPPSE